jgi:Flp pilus assembly protein TadG
MNPNQPIERRQPKPRAGRRAGNTMVQAALVLPVVLMFLLGATEYGRFLMINEVFTVAAREGAEYAAKHTDPIVLGGTTYGNATSDVTTQVSTYLAGMTLNSQSVTVFQSDNAGNNLGTWSSTSAGGYVGVQITGTYQFALPNLLFLPSTTTLTFKAVALCEGN